MADDVLAGRERLNHVRGRPDGKTIIARAAGGAVLDERIAHADAKVDAIGHRIAHTAAFDYEVAGIVDPHAGFRVFNPDA